MHEKTILTHAVNIHNKLDLGPESLVNQAHFEIITWQRLPAFHYMSSPIHPYFSFSCVFDFLPSTEGASVEEGEFKKINKMDFGRFGEIIVIISQIVLHTRTNSKWTIFMTVVPNMVYTPYFAECPTESKCPSPVQATFFNCFILLTLFAWYVSQWWRRMTGER